jgi:hypothetical protein
MADINKSVVYTVQFNEKGKVNIKGLTKGFVDAEIAQSAFGKSLKTTNKELDSQISKTGLAGAALNEFGRAISDSNYGIQGVANNLQQLSGLLVTLYSTTGGVKEAFSELKKVFFGPVGLILLFTTVITLIEKFELNNRKLIKSQNDLAKATSKAGSDLKILLKLIDANSLSTLELERSVVAVNKKYKDLNITIGENGRITEESRKQIESKISSLERLAKATAMQKKLEELFSKEIELQMEKQEKLDTLEENKFSKRIKRFTNTGAASVRSEEEIQELYEEGVKKIEDSFKKREEAVDKEKSFILKSIAEQGLANEIFNMEDSKLASEVNELKIGNSEKLKGVLKNNNVEQLADDLAAAEKLEARSKKMWNATRKRLRKDFFSTIKDISSEVERVNKLLFSSFESQRQMEFDQIEARTQALLANEKLTQKERISILRNAEEEKRKISEKAIEQELKMAQLSAGIQATQLALQILADQGALGAKLSLGAGKTIGELGFPAAIPALAAYAAMAAGIVAQFVAAKRKANLAISRLDGFSGSSSGVGGAGGVEAPDFNIVGASPESQLAQSVSQQQTQPLRAFVVHKDIKNANDLDRTITTTSSLG